MESHIEAEQTDNRGDPERGTRPEVQANVSPFPGVP